MTNCCDTLPKLLPPGNAFRFTPDSTGDKFIKGLSDELERFCLNLDPALYGALPDSLISIKEWAETMGLPDECLGFTTDNELLGQILAKLRFTGGQSIQHLRDILFASGYNSNAYEPRPFRVSKTRVGKSGDYGSGRVYSRDVQFQFIVELDQTALQYLRVDDRVHYEEEPNSGRFEYGDFGNIVCIIERWKPAHTTYWFVFADPRDAM